MHQCEQPHCGRGSGQSSTIAAKHNDRMHTDTQHECADESHHHHHHHHMHHHTHHRRAFSEACDDDDALLHPHIHSRVPHTEELVVFVRYCSNSGLPIHLCYQCFGNPHDRCPVVLLVCGLNMQLTAWDEKFCESLARAGFFVIRYDNRDSGHSTKVEHSTGKVIGPGLLLPNRWASFLGEKLPYTMEDMAKDGLALLDVLQVPCAHVFGISMGGMIAQTITLLAPHRVLSLTSIMSTTNAPNLPDTQMWVKLKMLRTPPKRCTIDELLEFRVNCLTDLLKRALPLDKDYVKERYLISLRRSNYSAGLVRQAAAIRRCPGRDEALAKLTVPALVIHGAQDLVVPPVHGYRTAMMLRHSRILVLKSMGHYFHPAFFRIVVDTFAEMAACTVGPGAPRRVCGETNRCPGAGADGGAVEQEKHTDAVPWGMLLHATDHAVDMTYKATSDAATAAKQTSDTASSSSCCQCCYRAGNTTVSRALGSGHSSASHPTSALETAARVREWTDLSETSAGDAFMRHAMSAAATHVARLASRTACVGNEGDRQSGWEGGHACDRADSQKEMHAPPVREGDVARIGATVQCSDGHTSNHTPADESISSNATILVYSSTTRTDSYDVARTRNGSHVAGPWEDLERSACTTVSYLSDASPYVLHPMSSMAGMFTPVVTSPRTRAGAAAQHSVMTAVPGVGHPAMPQVVLLDLHDSQADTDAPGSTDGRDTARHSDDRGTAAVDGASNRSRRSAQNDAGGVLANAYATGAKAHDPAWETQSAPTLLAPAAATSSETEAPDRQAPLVSHGPPLPDHGKPASPNVTPWTRAPPLLHSLEEICAKVRVVVDQFSGTPVTGHAASSLCSAAHSAASPGAASAPDAQHRSGDGRCHERGAAEDVEQARQKLPPRVHDAEGLPKSPAAHTARGVDFLTERVADDAAQAEGSSLGGPECAAVHAVDTMDEAGTLPVCAAEAAIRMPSVKGTVGDVAHDELAHALLCPESPSVAADVEERMEENVFVGEDSRSSSLSSSSSRSAESGEVPVTRTMVADSETVTATLIPPLLPNEDNVQWLLGYMEQTHSVDSESRDGAERSVSSMPHPRNVLSGPVCYRVESTPQERDG